jgi:hypothetical protein
MVLAQWDRHWEDAKWPTLGKMRSRAQRKFLGAKGKIPRFPKTIEDANNAVGESWDGFVEARENLKGALHTHETNFLEARGALG